MSDIKFYSCFCPLVDQYDNTIWKRQKLLVVMCGALKQYEYGSLRQISASPLSTGS